MGFASLSTAQRALVEEWMPGAQVVADLSWNRLDTVVLRVRHDGSDVIVKAAPVGDHHLERELDAHLGGFIDAWSAEGRAPRPEES